MPFLDKHKIRLRNHWLQGLQKYINHNRSFKFSLLLLLSALAPLTWICLFTADFKYINQLTSVITLVSKECVHKFMKVISKFLDTLHVKLWLNSPEGMKMGLCMDLYKFEACMWIIISVNIFSKIDFDMWALLYNFSYLNNLIFNN